MLLLTNWRMQPTVGLTLTIDNSSGWLPAFEIARIGSTDAEVKIKAVGNMFLFGLRPVRCQRRRRLGIHVTVTGPRKRLQALRVCGGSTGKEC